MILECFRKENTFRYLNGGWEAFGKVFFKALILIKKGDTPIKYVDATSTDNAKLKPWQLTSNNFYASYLIKNNQALLAIEFLKSGKTHTCKRETLLSNARYLAKNSKFDHMEKLIEFLEEN